MSIAKLQRRLTTVGSIRLGLLTTGRNGQARPAKLETFRITSPSRSLMEAVADLYGGEVKPWKAPSGPQWEVITDAKEIRVLVPPQRIDPNMEHWGNGYRDRLCDGETEMIRKAPCLCAAQAAAGRPGKPGDVCKPTTRMSLMLAKAPGIGTFKLESKGWNAAAELPMLAASIESAPEPIPARLVLEVRGKKVFHPDRPQGDQIEPRVYMVPILLFDWLTPEQAFGGELGTAARAALGAANTDRQAITADVDPGHRKFTPAEYLALTEAAEDIDHVRELWRDAAGDDALTDAVAAALHAKVAKIEKAAEAKPQPAPTAPADDVADVVDDAVVWAEIQQAAGERGWSADDLERRIQDTLGVSSTDADGFALTRFHDALRAGDVA
jgi:hypothetical protein